MNLPDSIRQWIQHRQPDFNELGGINIYADGESDIASPPMIVIDETGSSQTVQAGVPIRGVNTFSLVVQLHTIPSPDGTSAMQARIMKDALYAIVGDTAGMRPYIDGLNETRVLDIFCDSPIVSADDGRRVSTYNLEVLAHPI
jgi:hypothetical protein